MGAQKGTFTNHVDWSSKHNRFYWVFFASEKEGVYELKTFWPSGPGIATIAIGATRCPLHPGELRPAEEVQVKVEVKQEGRVKTEVKTEPGVIKVPRATLQVKEEGRALASGSRDLDPHWEEQQQADWQGHVPLYDPNSSEEDVQRALLSEAGPAAGALPASASLSATSSMASTSAAPTSVPSLYIPSSADESASPEITSVSSLTASSASRVAAKGKGRAASVAPNPLLTDPYYVGPTGSIHHSKTDALAEVETGAVQVVIGWDAASKFMEKVARKASVMERLKLGESMEVDT
ncbi:hypothetical protein C8R43DRAFT_941704 [Mycena crocata]|nr:hypothetical protein C8R43DRAFT_941704 [Mycena crocata]